MPSRKSKPKTDDNTQLVRAVDRVTDSEQVRGEDLLPPRLKTELRAAKKQAAKQR